MSEIDLKIKALRIYLEEIQQIHQQLRLQNEEIVGILAEQGHKNIREELKHFQIKYITQKIAQILP
jgi:preprotein translocase subunit Sec63